MFAWAAAQVPERIHKEDLAQVLSVGEAPPQSLRSMCLDLKDTSQPSYASMISMTRSATCTSEAFAAVVECALSHTAASLESLCLFIPHLRSPLPAMAALQHLTLHQDSFCTFSNLHVSGLPRLRSLVLLQVDSAKRVRTPAPHLDLGCLHELEALYLVSQLPEALTLPQGCALHVSGSCRRILEMHNLPEWEQALAQVQSVCEDHRLGGGVLPTLSVDMWPQSSLSNLTALSIVCPENVSIGSKDEPRGLSGLPALERLVLHGGTMHIYFPADLHLKRLWTRHTRYFYFNYPSEASFTCVIEDLCIMGRFHSSLSSLKNALQERGTPLVTRQQQGERPVQVIEGCRYDPEAGQQRMCACQTCLDCLVRRSCRPSELPSALAEAPF